MKFWGIRLGSFILAFGACLLLDMLVTGKFPAVFGGLDDFGQRLVVLAGLYITLSVSLNLINGITGQFSIGHAAFYQVGAYAAGFISVSFYKNSPIQGLPWLILMMVASALVAGLAGFIVGLPSLRLRGDYLAIVTLGFGEIIRIIVQNQEPLGGSYGLRVEPKFQFIWLVLLLAIGCIALCRNLLRSAHGLQFLAVREDEVAASAMGVNVTRAKVTAFVLGSALAGAAGALLAHFETFISPNMFAMDLSFIILTMVVLGGTGSITGSAIAAVALFYLPEKLRDIDPVPGNALVGWVLAVGLGVAAIRYIEKHYHAGKLQRAAALVGAIVAAYIVQRVLTGALSGVSFLTSSSFEAAKLRMVIFAATLVILMLIRPQGVFGHHEFSWDWVARLFKRGKSQEATV